MALNPLEYTELNKLYVITLSVHNLLPASYKKILFEIPLILFANSKWRRDGQWGTSTFGATMMSAASGFWTISDKPLGQSKYVLSLYEEEPPNAVANFFGAAAPVHLGLLSDVPKFPIPAGSAGTGIFYVKARGTKAGGAKPYFLDWKVNERRF